MTNTICDIFKLIRKYLALRRKIDKNITITDNGSIEIVIPNHKDFPTIRMDIDADGSKKITIPYDYASAIMHKIAKNREIYY